MEATDDVNLVMLALNLFGALSVFLFGMSTLSSGLKSALGSRLKDIIQTSCSHPALAVVTGTVATGALNSATAVSVLVVEFVQSGDMSFQQSLGVCLGICVGSTLTPYLVAFKLTQYALPLAALGKAISSLSGSKSGKHVGSAVFGMGLMFLGMGHMGASITPLRSYPPFLTAIASLSNPLLGLVVSAIATMVLNSSSAMLGIAIALAQQGLLPLPVGIAIVLGSNVGTTGAPLIAAVASGTSPLRFAVAYTGFKSVIALLALPLLGPFTAASVQLAGGGDADVAGTIAAAHTLFNVVLAVVFFPVLSLVAKCIERAVKPEHKVA